MSRARIALPYVLLTALGVRCLAAVGVEHLVSREPGRRFLIAGDAEGYWQLAERITRGEDFAIHDPPRYALRTPGFPVLLAVGMVLVGGSRLGVRIWLAIVGTAACLLVFLLGRTLVDDATGIVAAGVTAISPTLAGFSVLVLSETAFSLAMLASLLAFHRVVATPRGDEESTRFGSAMLVGLSLGIAVLIRPAWLLAAPVFGVVDVALAANRRRALVRTGLMFVALAATLLPWTIRNRIVTGHLVPTTLWLGPTLYDGLHPGADGGSDMRFFEDDRAAGVTVGMTEYEVDRHYRGRAWRFVAENPGTTAWLAWRKQLRYWSPWPNARQFRHPIGILGVLAFYVPMLLLGAYGLWRMRFRPRFLLLTAGPLLYFAALHLVFVGSLRYRLPAEYAMWIASAAGLLTCRPSWHAWLSESPKPSVPSPSGDSPA